MSIPSLKMSTVKIARSSPRLSFVDRLPTRSSRGVEPSSATAGRPASLNCAAMNRACATPAQKPSARICVGSSTQSATAWRILRAAHMVPREHVLEFGRDVPTAFESRPSGGRSRPHGRSSGTGRGGLDQAPAKVACRRRCGRRTSGRCPGRPSVLALLSVRAGPSGFGVAPASLTVRRRFGMMKFVHDHDIPCVLCRVDQCQRIGSATGLTRRRDRRAPDAPRRCSARQTRSPRERTLVDLPALCRRISSRCATNNSRSKP